MGKQHSHSKGKSKLRSGMAGNGGPSPGRKPSAPSSSTQRMAATGRSASRRVRLWSGQFGHSGTDRDRLGHTGTIRGIPGKSDIPGRGRGGERSSQRKLAA